MNQRTRIRSEVYRLFNPYHDAKGLFTTAARNVTGAARAYGKWAGETKKARKFERSAAAFFGATPQAKVAKLAGGLMAKDAKKRVQFAKWLGGQAFGAAKHSAETRWRATQAVAKITGKAAKTVGKTGAAVARTTPTYKAAKKEWERK